MYPMYIPHMYLYVPLYVPICTYMYTYIPHYLSITPTIDYYF